MFKWAVCIGEDCKDFDGREYVQERSSGSIMANVLEISAEGMTTGRMCRTEVWRGKQSLRGQNWSADDMREGSMYRRGAQRVLW